MRLAAAAALALLLLACSSSDDATAPFPDGEGEVVIPTIHDDWTVRSAFSDDVPDPAAHTYLRGGGAITVYGRGDDDLVFVQRLPSDSLGELEHGWQPFRGWPSLAEGDRYFTARGGDEVVFGWRRGASDEAVESAVAGADPDGYEVVGELPSNWEESRLGPQLGLDIDDGRGPSFIALRRSPTPEQAAFRALLKDAAVAAELATRASVDDPITTDPTRRVEVGGRAALIGPLSESVRVLVVEGDPGLTILTSGNRLANFISDDGLLAIAEGVRTASRDELAAWLDERREDERAAERAAMEEVGDILFEAERLGALHRIIRFDDGSLCVTRSGGDSHCEPAKHPLVARIGDGIVGVVIEHSAVAVELPDGGTVAPELELMDPGGLVFFVEVADHPGPVRVIVNGETFDV